MSLKFDCRFKKCIFQDDYGREIEIVGVVAKDGEEVRVGEQFKVCSDTVVTYLSKLYRLVFVLDLSPSTVVAVFRLFFNFFPDVFNVYEFFISAENLVSDSLRWDHV